MVPLIDPDAHLTEWQRRVKATDLVNWAGKRPEEMTDAECQAVIEFIGRRCRVYYV